MKGYIGVAQVSAQNPSPSQNSFNIDPNLVGSLGGIGLAFWGAVQIYLKVWEKKATTLIATESVKNEAEISQEKQALGTIVEVFRQNSEASIALQSNAFKNNADLISQLSSISANASHMHYESIKESVDRIADHQKEANQLQRQHNIALVDLTEVVKRIEWRLDNATGRTN